RRRWHRHGHGPRAAELSGTEVSGPSECKSPIGDRRGDVVGRMTARSTQIRLAAYPVGEPSDASYETRTEPVPDLQDGQVLLRTIYLSLDPYMRGRMSTAKSYAAPVPLGGVMLGGTVCEVVESCSPRRAAGDIVLAYTGWQTHAVVDARYTRRLDASEAPVSTALGVLGMPGFTGYAG